MAITREIPNSFIHALSTHHDGNSDDFSWNVAKQQHDDYVQALRSYIPHVIHLPAIELYPDSCFVEDTAIIMKHNDASSSSSSSVAIMTRPGHETRRREVHDIKETLIQHCHFHDDTKEFILATTNEQLLHDHEPNHHQDDDKLKKSNDQHSTSSVLYDMNHPLLLQHDKYYDATCDGGDILYYPGSSIVFIGLSNRTNDNGAALLHDMILYHNNITQQHKEPQQQLQVMIVPPIIQGNHVLHLKSAVTYFDATTVVIPTGTIGDALIDGMKLHNFQYDIITIPDILTCNIVTINHDTVFVQDTSCMTSRHILELAAKERHLRIEYINTSELAKKDAALTCCSLLL